MKEEYLVFGDLRHIIELLRELLVPVHSILLVHFVVLVSKGEYDGI